MNDIDMYMSKGGVQGRAGQATMVESSRAMEEVRAQVILARQFPRSVPQAIERIRGTFSVKAMADRSFYSYPKGRGNVVTGSTIHLAKAVAQAWGNLTYGIDELSRIKGQSEIRAWAWDLETNQRVSTTFIVEHAIDVKDGLKEVTDLRGIYENNANMGNRRLRAQIESVIPAYVMDMAKEVAGATIRSAGNGQPLAVRIDKAVQAFAALGVDAERVELERGRERGRWTEIDLGHLRVLLTTIQNGEIAIDDAFPPREITVDDVRPVAAAQSAPTVPDAGPLPESATWPMVGQTTNGRRAVGRGEVQDVMSVDEWAGVEYPTTVDGDDAIVWPQVAQPGSGE